VISLESKPVAICGNKMPTRCNRCFLLQILLLAQHVSGTIIPIIRSSRVLYSWLPSVVVGAWFSSYRYGVELRVVCPVCGLRAASKTVGICLLSVYAHKKGVCTYVRTYELMYVCMYVDT
jgi:hypothetical protein